MAGSIAGDDTIFLATPSAAAAAKLARLLEGRDRPAAPPAGALVSAADGARLRRSARRATREASSARSSRGIRARPWPPSSRPGGRTRGPSRSRGCILPSAAVTGPSAEAFSLDALAAGKPDVVFLATPNETSAEVGRTDPRARREGRRRLGRVPAAGRRGLPGVVRVRPPVAGAPRRGRLRPHGVVRAGAPRRAPRREPRLLPDVGPPRPEAAPPASRPGARPSSRTARAASRERGRSPTSRTRSPSSRGTSRPTESARHRHEPEMRQELGLSADAPFVFVPHLLPVVRGILSTLHVTFRAGVGPADVAARVRAVRGRPVRVRAAGGRAARTSRASSGRRAPRSASRSCPGGRRGVVVSAIDNLLKGAASQAVQNMNRVFGFPETEGLV